MTPNDITFTEITHILLCIGLLSILLEAFLTRKDINKLQKRVGKLERLVSEYDRVVIYNVTGQIGLD